MWWVHIKRKKNPPKTLTENMLVVSSVHYQNKNIQSLFVHYRTKDYRAQTAIEGQVSWPTGSVMQTVKKQVSTVGQRYSNHEC